MRYLGNKQSLSDYISDILKNINLKNENVLDAFAGSGSASTILGNLGANVTANDYLYLSECLTTMRFYDFEKNKKIVDPLIQDFNDPSKLKKGYIYKNYSVAGHRKYFSEFNAQRIDYIINKIYKLFDNKEINKETKDALIGVLLEAVSKVSNIAGVYGAFLKKPDPRYFKQINLVIPDNCVITKRRSLQFTNLKIEDFLKSKYNRQFKLAYLDPPYTTQQYSHQYHLLETIATNAKSKVSGITGSRGTEIGSSDFSKSINAQVSLFDVIRDVNAEYVLISYNNNGIIAEDLLDNFARRLSSAHKKQRIAYKKYRNKVSKNIKNENYELLYLLKKADAPVFESPLNYSGSKYKMVPFIKSNLPKNVNKAIDIFGGGFNVGANLDIDNIVYNDINYRVKDLIKCLKEIDTVELIRKINFYIKKFKLSKNGKDSFKKARDHYNKSNAKDPILLLVLIFYGYSHQIRFNANMEFNNTPGLSDFNSSLQEKTISFSEHLKSKNVRFESKDFEEFIDEIDKETFVYLDPPYLITTGSYNDGKRGVNKWDAEDERRLLNFIKKIDSKGGKFMLSNVIEHNGKTNSILKEWIKENNFVVTEVPSEDTKNRKEIIVTNY